MPTYCLDARITEELMNNLPAEITATYRAAQISDAGYEVDGLVGPNFPLDYNSSQQRFPEITASPVTPVLIQKCTIWLACSYIWTTIFATTRFSGEGETESPDVRYRNLVTNSQNTGLADRIRLGEMQIVLTNGTVLGSQEDPAHLPIEWSEENRTNIISSGRTDSSGNTIGDSQILDNF